MCVIVAIFFKHTYTFAAAYHLVLRNFFSFLFFSYYPDYNVNEQRFNDTWPVSIMHQFSIEVHISISKIKLLLFFWEHEISSIKCLHTQTFAVTNISTPSAKQPKSWSIYIPTAYKIYLCRKVVFNILLFSYFKTCFTIHSNSVCGEHYQYFLLCSQCPSIATNDEIWYIKTLETKNKSCLSKITRKLWLGMYIFKEIGKNYTVDGWGHFYF